MHRTMRTLAVGSIVSLSTLIGWAAGPEGTPSDSEDLQIRRPAAKTPAGLRSPSLSGLRKRNPADQETLPRNYYQELFNGGETPERTPERPGPKKEEGSAKVFSNRSLKKSAAVAPPPPKSKVPETSFDDDEDLDADEDDWPNLGSPRVKQAEYGHPPEAAISKVRQTPVDVRPKSARIPVPPLKTRDASLTSAIGAPSDSSPVTQAAFVSGPQTSSISLEWVKKSEMNVGQECQVELVVKNTGAAAVDQVAVDAMIQSPVRLTAARPQPVENVDRLTWNLPTLPAGSEQRISLKLIPSRRGDLGLTAQVRLTNTAQAAFRVEEPLLKVALKGPTEVMLGDSASQMVTVSNPGTGAAHDVKITARVSNGLEHARGGSPVVEMEIGTITPGESRTLRLPLTGVRGGEQTISVTANSSSSSEMSNVVTAAVNIISPSLLVSANGPALRYKGRNAKFTVTVTNDGSVANNNVRVTQSVADGFQFLSADHGGKFDPSQKTVSWFLGRLEPDQTVQVGCELTAVGLGEFTQNVAVTSDAGARAETAIDTQVDGTPSLTMQVVDLDDPVEVGVETAYEIRIKNEGSKSATNVAVTCELSPGVQLLSAKGPTDARAEQRTLVFKPVAQISPGQESIFRVHVKGMQAGDLRVKARVSSDSLEEPLLKEEQTKFYSDSRR